MADTETLLYEVADAVSSCKKDKVLEAVEKAKKLLEENMPEGTWEKKLDVIVNGTVEGDVHGIGKSIVSTMLQTAGFEVHDIGSDVPIQNFIQKAKEVDSDMIGISALMTTTLQGQREVIDLFKEESIRSKIKVMVGGTPATQAWADKIGEDCYAENASEAVAKKPGVDILTLTDEHVMREHREELDIRVITSVPITSVPGAAKGIAAKINIEKLPGVRINSCEQFRAQLV